MKKFRSSRLLSLLLAIIFVVGVFPTAALAAGKGCALSNCNCQSCGWYYGYASPTSTRHDVWVHCTNCSAQFFLKQEAHSFSSNGYCTECGYYNSSYDTSVCYHTSTYYSWSGCHWYEYCRNCGTLVDYGTSHNYYYGSWEYYSASYHRRTEACFDCGESSYDYASHNRKTVSTPYDSAQHQTGTYCSQCQSYIGATSKQNHTFTYGNWEDYNGTQHRRSRSCSVCGYSDYQYESHSMNYGSWSSSDANLHKKTGTCSCGYTETEYADHTLTVTKKSVSNIQHRTTTSSSDLCPLYYRLWHPCRNSYSRR